METEILPLEYIQHNWIVSIAGVMSALAIVCFLAWIVGPYVCYAFQFVCLLIRECYFKWLSFRGTKTIELARLAFKDKPPSCGFVQLYRIFEKVIVVRDPVLAKRVLSDAFVFSRPHKLAIFASIFDIENVFTTHSVELHDQLKGIMRESVAVPRDYFEKMRMITRNIMNEFALSVGTPIDLVDFVESTVLRVFAATYIDIDCFPQATLVARTVKQLWGFKTRIEDAGCFGPIVSWLLHGKITLAKESLFEALDAAVAANCVIIEGNPNHGNINHAVDRHFAMDQFLGRRTISERRRHNLLNILIPGYETAGRIMTALVKQLLTMTDVVGQIIREADQILSEDCSFEIFARESRFIEAIWKEALRLFPAPPNLYRKVVRQDPDFAIGSSVAVCLQLMHTNPAMWQAPGEFNPDRWLVDGDLVAAGGRYFAPFGIGSQMCVAMKFAGVMAKVIIANIYGRFDVRAAQASSGGRPQIFLVPR